MPQPEVLNQAIRSIYRNNPDAPCKDDVADALADLRHICDKEEFNFSSLDRIAYSHYLEEKTRKSSSVPLHPNSVPGEGERRRIAAEAAETYGDENCEVDPDATVLVADEGFQVSAWVWIAAKEASEQQAPETHEA